MTAWSFIGVFMLSGFLTSVLLVGLFILAAVKANERSARLRDESFSSVGGRFGSPDEVLGSKNVSKVVEIPERQRKTLRSAPAPPSEARRIPSETSENIRQAERASRCYGNACYQVLSPAR